MTDEQRRDIAVALVSTNIVETARERSTFSFGEVTERSFVRIFACSFACNNTSSVANEREAHLLCELLFETYFDLLRESGVGDDDLQTTNRQLQDRFHAYYKATELIGTKSLPAIDVDLQYLQGKIPIEAFIIFESAFRSFVEPESPRPNMDTQERVRRAPMSSAFGLFLNSWQEAEGHIREVVGAKQESKAGQANMRPGSGQLRLDSTPGSSRAGVDGGTQAEMRSNTSYGMLVGVLIAFAAILAWLFLPSPSVSSWHLVLGWIAWALLLFFAVGWTLGCWIWSRSPTGVTPMTAATTLSWWVLLFWSLASREFNKAHLVWLAPTALLGAHIAFRAWMASVVMPRLLPPRSVRIIIPLLAGIYIAILWILT